MNENSFVSFKFHYSLSRKIPFSELSDNVPNVEFVKVDNYLTAFNITLLKSVGLKEAEKESEEYAYILSDLISIISHRYTIATLSGYEAVDIAGKGRTEKCGIYKWNVEGAPAKLDITHQLSSVLDSDNPQIRPYLGYLAKAVILEFEHFPDHSIIEAFKIIENNDKFPFYYKYFALRNGLAHSPTYFPNTVKYFKEYFDESTFDYIKYDPDHSIIILNLHSNRTQKELNRLLKELMDEIGKYLKIQ